MKHQRICIYSKDIAILTGKSLRYGQQVLQNIRFALKKEKHELITIYEYAEYSNIDIELIKQVCK